MGERRNVSQDVFFPYAFLPASDRTDFSIALSSRYPSGVDKQHLSLANQTSCLQGMAASSQLLHPEGREEDKLEGFQKRLMTWLSKVQSSAQFLLQPFPTLGKVGKCHFPSLQGVGRRRALPALSSTIFAFFISLSLVGRAGRSHCNTDIYCPSLEYWPLLSQTASKGWEQGCKIHWSAALAACLQY